MLIKSHPYSAKTDANGKFTIHNVPVGERVFQFWHERAGYLKDVEFKSRTLDKKGRLTLRVSAGENDLGDAKINSVQLAAG